MRVVEHVEDGKAWPVLLWSPGKGWRMISTGVVGGGIGPREWWLNAKVSPDYHLSARYHDPSGPSGHLVDIAASVGAGMGPGVGMLTAAEVTRWSSANDGGVDAVATVGLGTPVWASADDASISRETGTINLLISVPVPLSDAALVNAVMTATEAKTQALLEAGIPGTGTASDATCIACPEPGGRRGDNGSEDEEVVEEYGGPRSRWGLHIARAVHRAVADGTADWLTRFPDGDPRRRWKRSGGS